MTGLEPIKACINNHNMLSESCTDDVLKFFLDELVV